MKISAPLAFLAVLLIWGHEAPLRAADCAPGFVNVTVFVGQQLGGTPADESCRPMRRGNFQIIDDWGERGPRLCIRDCPGKPDGFSAPPRPVYEFRIDDFSVRYRVQQTFASGVYIFSVNADDGVRLRIDDDIVIDDWSIHAARLSTVERYLAAGPHDIEVEYFEGNQLAILQAGWRPK